MKIAVLGTRGFPNVQGGVEAHCENLYPRLIKMGCEVIVFGRAPYLRESGNGVSPIHHGKRRVGTDPIFYEGVKIIPLACPKNKFLEAFMHTLKGVFAARKERPDIVHIHAAGPSLFTPLARMFGMKVVITSHGPEYERKKWAGFPSHVLKVAEYLSCTWADGIISVSESNAGRLRKKYGRDVTVIPNGVTIPTIATTDGALKQYGLEKGKYVLTVGRFVPEKGFHDLIDAMADQNGMKLVVVGRADHEDKYSRSLYKKAENDPNIILTGFLSGTPLQELYSHAGLFVLPSYYEGLPIALLEAMSYGLSCLASDIDANREVALSADRYFKSGDVNGLSTKIREFAAKHMPEEEKIRQVRMMAEKYDWEKIASQTMLVYNNVASRYA